MTFTGSEVAVAAIIGAVFGSLFSSFLNIGSSDGAFKLLIEGYNQRKNRELDMKAKWIDHGRQDEGRNWMA